MNLNVDIDELVRDLSRESLYECVRVVWKTIIAEEPVFNWHMELMCNELQEVYERVFAGKPKEYDLIFNVPPGSSKSTIISVISPIWAWSRMPSLRSIVATHAYDLGLDLSRKGREVLNNEIPNMGKSFGQIHGLEVKKDLDSKGHFGIIGGGERYSCTVGGKSPIGKHAHILIIDDPIDPAKVFSDAAIENANNFMSHTLPSRMVNKAVTPIVLVMQRLHQNDPTGNMVKRYTKGNTPLKQFVIPAEVTDKVHPPELKERYVDGLLDPVRLTRSTLDNIRGSSGDYVYASQYLQTPIPLGGGMFKREQLEQRIVTQVPEMKAVVRYWDKAASHETGCYTAGVKIGKAVDGNFYIMNVRRFQKATDERERAIQATAAMDGRQVKIGMEVEPGSAGLDSIRASTRGLAGYHVLPEKPTGEKAVRADPFATQVNMGNVFMVAGEWNEDLLDEMEYFPNSTFKDQVDAAAGAFRMLTDATKIARAIG